jgi:hypothetical protein
MTRTVALVIGLGPGTGSGRSASNGKSVGRRERTTPRGSVTEVVARDEWLSPVP